MLQHRALPVMVLLLLVCHSRPRLRTFSLFPLCFPFGLWPDACNLLLPVPRFSAVFDFGQELAKALDVILGPRLVPSFTDLNDLGRGHFACRNISSQCSGQ